MQYPTAVPYLESPGALGFQDRVTLCPPSPWGIEDVTREPGQCGPAPVEPIDAFPACLSASDLLNCSTRWSAAACRSVGLGALRHAVKPICPMLTLAMTIATAITKASGGLDLTPVRTFGGRSTRTESESPIGRMAHQDQESEDDK